MALLWQRSKSSSSPCREGFVAYNSTVSKDPVAVTDTVAVGLALAVGDSVPDIISVALAEAVAVGDSVPEPTSVVLTDAVGLAVGDSVSDITSVALADAVGLSLAVIEGDSEIVNDAEAVGDADEVGLPVGDSVGVVVPLHKIHSTQ